jgi:pterin-4a-carbinolamine dehydratase
MKDFEDAVRFVERVAAAAVDYERRPDTVTSPARRRARREAAAAYLSRA